MHLQDIDFKIRWKSDSMYELAKKHHQNITYIKRWFGTGILSGGRPEILYSDQTDEIQIVSHWIFYKPVTMFRTEPYPAPDHTASHFTIVGDGTVNLWIEGDKVEFLPTGMNDSTIVEELRPSYDTTTDTDIQLPTKTIKFTTPIIGLIGHDPIYFDATNEYDLSSSDGTVWIYLDRDENFWEVRAENELDSTNYILLWSAKFHQIHAGPEGKIKRLHEVRDLRNVIPSVLDDFSRIHFHNPVIQPSVLPIAGSRPGDARVTTDSYKNYVWVYDTSNVGSITGNFWNPLGLVKGTYVDKAFSQLRFEQSATGQEYVGNSDSSVASLILAGGQHINLTATPLSDRITIAFEVDRNLDFNGLSQADETDPGRTNKIINVGNIDTTNMDIYGYIDVDGTANFGHFIDIKDTLRVYKRVRVQGSYQTTNLDMTRSSLITTKGTDIVADTVHLIGDLIADNVTVGSVQGIDITDHSARHEMGGDDEINVLAMNGITRGQNAGELQDRTVSNEDPIDGDIVTWDGNYWSPVSRLDRMVQLIEGIALWSDRKVPGKKPRLHNKFLTDNHKFTFDGKFLSGDQNETPPGNHVPMYSAWNYMSQKDMFAKNLEIGKLSSIPYSNAFRGSVFDGRYIYFAPRMSEYFVRYDTQIGFDQTAAYEALQITNIQPDATAGSSYYGCTFDGSYIYFVPSYNNSAVRHKIGHRFTDATAWEVFDLSDTFGILKNGTFAGGIFDGNYIYFVPLETNSGLKYNTRLPFDDPTAWVSGGPGPGYLGGTYDGKYVYFSPFDAHDFIRFLPENYASTNDWEIIDSTTILSLNFSTEDALSRSIDDGKFSGACFDGKYVYYTPHDATHFVRVNTYLPFNAFSSWQVVRCKDVIGAGGTWTPGWSTGGQGRWSACRFDGRYVYFSPEASPLFIKYDTQEDFRSAVSWDKVSFNMGDGNIMSNGYNISVHKYVNKNNQALLGTDRVMTSIGSLGTSLDYIAHVLWGQENRKFFRAQQFIDKNRAHPNDTTFTDCVIKVGLIDRDGKRMWVFTQYDAGHGGDFIYEMDLDGVVLSRRRVGTSSTMFNYNYGDVDQVYGHVYVNTQGGVIGINTNMRVARLNYPGTSKADRLVSVLLNTEANGTYNIFSAKKWNPGDNEWDSFLCHENIDHGAADNYVDLWTVAADGSLTYKKWFSCFSENVLQTGIAFAEYVNSFGGGLSIGDDGVFHGVHTTVGVANEVQGTFYAWDTTNWDLSLGVSGAGYPKLIRWSGYLTEDYTGSWPNVVHPNGGLKGAFGTNWKLRNKLVTCLSRDGNWLYVNLWSTPARIGRINTTFTEVQTWDGLWYLNSMGGLEVDGKHVYYFPADGRRAMKFKKPYKINLKSKLGWKASP